MHDALRLLSSLTDGDAAWIFDVASERPVSAGSVVVAEGANPHALWLVLSGQVAVTVGAAPERTIARLGPGELIGEMALLEGTAASATVTAVEDTRLLELAHSALLQHSALDPGFAARLYRALALVLSQRLRRTTRLEAATTTDDLGAGADAWRALETQLTAFKTLMVNADKLASKHGDVVPDDVQAQITDGMATFATLLAEHIGDRSSLDPHTRAVLGQRVQRELLPFLLLSEVADRMYRKPRGYAGDFMTIEIMYRNQPGGTGRLGPALDRAFRTRPANRAVMNRRGLLAEEIANAMTERQGERTHVTSLASGPAAELFDVFGTLQDPTTLKATCVDIDLQALAFVGERVEQRGLRRQFDLHNENLVYLAMGRRKLDLQPQDLIYSIGLIDYFADKFVVMLLDWIHDRLRPGGRVILGNFHPDNVDKALMDHVFEWQLIHRSEADMNALMRASKFGRDCTSIRFEDERVNLFAGCVKG
ncbi:MAG: cyclic nucleotide-binding domain-containing protein [Planctomycetota bacterium]